MSTLYDPEILQECADDLYSQARSIVIATVLKYLVGSIVIAVLAAAALAKIVPDLPDLAPLAIICICIGVAIAAGISVGRAKAFTLKLEAQKLLCQRQVELNTRGESHALSVGA